MVSVLLEVGTVSPSRAPGFIPGYCGVRVAHLFKFSCYVLFCLFSYCVIRHEHNRRKHTQIR
jgi:hypothetical protein